MQIWSERPQTTNPALLPTGEALIMPEADAEFITGSPSHVVVFRVQRHPQVCVIMPETNAEFSITQAAM
jgi:hypothetical protein